MIKTRVMFLTNFNFTFQKSDTISTSCIFFYSQIVMAVVKHERALKEQAKKMNVESLRQGDHVRRVVSILENIFKVL